MGAAAAGDDVGSLLAGLRLGTDQGFVGRLRARVRDLPPKPLRVLVVTDAAMKYQEKAVLTFLGHAPFSRCDAWIARSRERSLEPAVRGLRYVTEREARAGGYDRVIGFDANAAFVEQCAWHECPGSFVGKVREPHRAGTREALAQLVARVRTYTTHVSLPNQAAALDAFFGSGRSRPCGGIDLPPNLDLHLAPGGAPRFPCVLLGGGDRDYAFALAHAGRVAGGIVVTQGDLAPGKLDAGADREALVAMRSDPRFTMVPRLPPVAYARLLLHARIVLVPVRGRAEGDYTCIADAAWYGRPVLTNRVAANAHMGDRVLFYDGPGELEARFRELEDPARWRESSSRAREAARRRSDLFALLERVYLDL